MQSLGRRRNFVTFSVILWIPHEENWPLHSATGCREAVSLNVYKQVWVKFEGFFRITISHF